MENGCKYSVKVCTASKCKKKNRALFNTFMDAFGLSEGETLSEEFSADLTAMDCVYNCGDGPIVMVNETICKEVSAQDALRIAEEIKTGKFPI